MLKNNFLFIIIIYSLLYSIEYFFSILNDSYPFNFITLNLNTGAYFFLFILIVSFAKIRLQLLIVGVIFTGTLFQLLNFQYFNSYILPISFYQFFTQFNEISESFMGEIMKMIFPIFIVLTAAFTSTLFIWRHNLFMKKLSTPWWVLAFLILFLSDLYQFNTTLQKAKVRLWQFQAQQVMPMPNNLAVNNAYRSLRYFMLGILPKKIKDNGISFPTVPSPQVSSQPDLNIVFVIGESLRAEQLSILGYKYQTTPLLESTANLYATSVYSSGTMTKSAIAAIVNRLEYPGVTSQVSSQSNCLFKLAKGNLFTTHFISAQTSEQLAIVDNLLCRKHIDYYSNRPKGDTKGASYELAIIDKLDNINFDNNNFIVLHQRGSHSPYKKRSPREFKKFDLEYDNSVLFTDYVIDKLINKIKQKSNKATYIVYTSDHGELLSGEGLVGHGWFEKQVYQVPFIFYFHNPLDEINHLKSELPYVLSHFDISTLITQLLGYRVDINKEPTREIYINGSDIDGLAGYMKIKVKNKKIINTKVFQ